MLIQIAPTPAGVVDDFGAGDALDDLDVIDGKGRDQIRALLERGQRGLKAGEEEQIQLRDFRGAEMIVGEGRELDPLAFHQLPPLERTGPDAALCPEILSGKIGPRDLAKNVLGQQIDEHEPVEQTRIGLRRVKTTVLSSGVAMPVNEVGGSPFAPRHSRRCA